MILSEPIIKYNFEFFRFFFENLINSIVLLVFSRSSKFLILICLFLPTNFLESRILLFNDNIGFSLRGFLFVIAQIKYFNLSFFKESFAI